MYQKRILVIALSLLVVFFAGCTKKDTSVPVAVEVSAGKSQNIQLPVDSVIITGVVKSGLTDNTIYLWTIVSGPSVPVFSHNAAASTVVGNLIAGKYILQFSATNNQGSTGTDTTSIIVTASPIHTLTLQPANNPDEFGMEQLNGTDRAPASSPQIEVWAWTTSSLPYYAREVIKFDLTSIPVNATIISANLYFYSDSTPQIGNLVDANYGANNSIVLQQITSPWTSSSISWSKPPAITDVNKVEIPSTPLSFLDLNLDVKGIVASMVSQNANYGFYMKLNNEVAYTDRDFVSSFNTAHPGRHPKLVITYQ